MDGVIEFIDSGKNQSGCRRLAVMQHLLFFSMRFVFVLQMQDMIYGINGIVEEMSSLYTGTFPASIDIVYQSSAGSECGPIGLIDFFFAIDFKGEGSPLFYNGILPAYGIKWIVGNYFIVQFEL